MPKSKLDYRILGNTGLKVTTVGFGCMITSDPSVITRAADLGVTYFDTARGYQHGNNERMVGAALGAKRKQVVVSTKSGAGNKDQLLKDLDTSLAELKTDYVDIWYLHGKDSPEAINDDMIEAQHIAKQQGKIRFAGMSTHALPRQLGWTAEKKAFDVVLVTYNFAMDPKMDDAIAAVAKTGTGVVAMKVMAGGFRAVGPAHPLYEKLHRGGAMLAALKWVLNKPHIGTTIPSMTDMDQLDENLRAMAEPFAAGDGKILTAHLEQIRPLYCRMCGQCDGACAQGLPVADVLRILTYADGYREFALAQGAVPGASRSTHRGPLRRLRGVYGSLSIWRARRGAHGPRAGTLRMIVSQPPGTDFAGADFAGTDFAGADFALKGLGFSRAVIGAKSTRASAPEGGSFFRCLLVLICITLAPTAPAAAQDYLNCHFVPGWEQSGAKRQYTADNLYDYKDGGAEGYLIFGFARMQGIDCQAGAATLAIDVSDMADADSAYGMFAANRDPKEPIAKIGMGGQVLAQSLIFAKGRYFVEIVETDGNPNSNQSAALQAFAAKMEPLLEGRVTPPVALGWFPRENQVSIRLVPESVLGLKILKRGYVAQYDHGQAFMVEEESAKAASETMKKLRRQFEGAAPAQIADEAFAAQAPYLDGICVFRKGRYIAGYANMPDPVQAAALAAKLVARLP